MKTWQRLLDNPTLWSQYFIRERVIRAIRLFFEKQSFHEVETPLLIPHPPAESYLEIFETTLLDRQRNKTSVYLSTSPEIPLKKLLVAGIGNCFSLTKSFRNMEMQSTTHNPEFTILEWYRVGVSYTEIMKDCEELFLFIQTYLTDKHLVTDSTPSHELLYQGALVDLASPWERLTVKEAFLKWANVSFDEFLNIDIAKKIATQKGYAVEDHTTWEELYNQIFLNEIELHLGKGKPTILYEFPAGQAALARKKSDDPRFAERFEFYVDGLELGDCYGELTDWKEQEAVFVEQMKVIKDAGRTTYDFDQDFIEALKVGMPESSGIAIGVDRLVMLFSNATKIQDTLFFPMEELL